MTKRLGICVVLLLLAVRAAAQIPGPQAPAPVEAVTDPLGRDTPRGAIAGFASAVRRQDFPAASAYMQLTSRQRRDVEALARTVSGLLDRYFTEPISTLSAAPGGTPDDGLPLDRERLTLTLPDREANVELLRIKDPQAGSIWLISSASLEAARSLQPLLRGASWVERWMPAWIAGKTWLGVPAGRWVAWLASIAVPFVLFSVVAAVIVGVVRRRTSDPLRQSLVAAPHHGIVRPIVVALTLGVHLAVIPQFGFSLAARLLYRRCALFVMTVVLAWLLWRVTKLVFAQAALAAERRGLAGRRSLMLLGERVAKAIVILLSIFALLAVLGVETTTALAGVGIGGVALALGAQKSVENLLGGVFLLSDRALAVGDLCCISGRVGRIEDITLRSVRMRTTEQSLVSIPAGVLSQENIENFTSRTRMLLQCRLPLRYGTPVVQLRSIISQLQDLLARDPELEAASVRLVAFSPAAIEIDLFAYVITADLPTFAASRERLLLSAAAIVESAGSGFALPLARYQGDADAGTIASPQYLPVSTSGPRAASGRQPGCPPHSAS